MHQEEGDCKVGGAAALLLQALTLASPLPCSAPRHPGAGRPRGSEGHTSGRGSKAAPRVQPQRGLSFPPLDLGVAPAPQFPDWSRVAGGIHSFIHSLVHSFVHFIQRGLYSSCALGKQPRNEGT